ncbi:hypothetical protein [Streptomyces parvulus]|uniref:hypothetical protein n=1 Tax=Streptomyces parvulus TaxID=146923 RepID=UPI0036984FAD
MAARLDTDRGTVSRWRTRFPQRRLDGLSEEPRPGVPRWSKREPARRVGISPTSVLRIWRAFGLQPWAHGDLQDLSGPTAARQDP